MRDKIMTRTINSIVGHFVAECNLDKKVTYIRDPRNKFELVAFVPSVEKADVLQAIRRVGQKVKLEQSLALLGIQPVKSESEIDMAKADSFIKQNSMGSGKERTKVKTPLRPGGSLPTEADEEEPVVEIRKAAAPKSQAKSAKQEKPTIMKRAKAPSKKIGTKHGW